MKNPMTLQQKHQALDDVEAGHPMQVREIGSSKWMDRLPEYIEQDLDFIFNEYRRKPEQLVRYAFILDNGYSFTCTTLRQARETRTAYNGEGTIHRLVEDLDWVEPSPAMPPKNPWRLVIDGSTPECNPVDMVTFKYMGGSTFTIMAGDFNWASGNATHWRYAEDE